MARTNSIFNCPQCDGTLRETDSETFVCPECHRKIHKKIAENARVLEELADSNLPAAELAELLLEGKVD